MDQFQDASATRDFSEGPDLQMIMQMLEMVRLIIAIDSIQHIYNS